MRHLNLFCLITLIATVSACGGKGNNNGDTQKIAKINIVGAESLFISGGTANGSASAVSLNNESNTNASTLFEITSDGYVQAVTYTDENGNPVTIQNQPVGVYNVNADYVMVVFGTNTYNPQDAYLVRKTDGAVYETTPINDNGGPGMGGMAPVPIQNYFKNSSPVMADGNNDIYFYGNRASTGNGGMSNTVYKIINPATTPSIEDYIPTTDTVRTFTIDVSGNILYSGNLASDNSSQIDRIKTLNSALDNFSPDNETYWQAADGNVYYLNHDNTNGYQIKKVTVDSSFNVIDTNYGPSDNTDDALWFTPWQSYLLNFSNETLIVSTNGGNSGPEKIIEVYNVSHTPFTIDLSSTFNSITTTTSSNNYYYLAGTDTNNKGVLKKCAVSDNICSDLLTPGQYDVYAMVVSTADEIVTFNALRMSDGAKIIATVDNSGVVTVLDTSLNTQVTTLVRVL